MRHGSFGILQSKLFSILGRTFIFLLSPGHTHQKNHPAMFKMCHHHMLEIQFGFCGMRGASSKLNFLWTMFMDICKSATNCKSTKIQEDRNGVREKISLGTLDHWNICWMQRAWHLSNNVENHDPYKPFPPCSSQAHRLLCHPCWF